MRVSEIALVHIHVAAHIFYMCLYVSLCKLQSVMDTSATQVRYYSKFDFCVNCCGIWEITLYFPVFLRAM